MTTALACPICAATGDAPCTDHGWPLKGKHRARRASPVRVTAPEAGTAAVYEIGLSRDGTTRLLLAVCGGCGSDVLHGGGAADLADLTPYLGERVAHCRCGGTYSLALGEGVTG